VIAADSQLTVDDSLRYNCEKLFRVKDGIIGFVGTTSHGMELLRHLQKSDSRIPPPTDGNTYYREDFGALLLTAHGIYIYDESLIADRVTGPFFALGTGALAALGAMERGANAIEAVKVACKYDTYCREPVRWMSLKRAR
jgi:ATP-dependent protease HslVU (ClpYQ) peptidase subunit